MPLDPVELTKQIKAASDVVAVVGGYLTLRPAGPVFKCLCPFHNDSRPSLDVDPRRQRYRCWACGAHGDVITFVQHMEKVDFKEARSILATRAGIKLETEPLTPQDLARSRLFDVMKWAQGRYQDCLLNDPVAEGARKYLGERKLSGATVRQFGLGFAPLAGDWITRLAHADGVPPDTLAEVGLIAARQEGRGFYDRFRDRVMFPIRDVQARPIGFGGRIMPESPYASRSPKYYNSAETPLFSKSDVLYGLDLARQAGATVGYLAVVEGYTDVMMAHQCGVPQVVATMGTALNARHVAQIRRYVPKVVLVYDADAGGSTGVDRALELFVREDVELAVATLPDGLDPCDLLSQPGGVETFKKVLAGAVDALDFKLNALLERDASPSVEATRRVIDGILGIMATAPARPSQAAQMKQELIVTRLSHRLGVRQQTVLARLAELKDERRKKVAGEQAADRANPGAPGGVESRGTRPAAPPAAKSSPTYTLEVTLLRLLIVEPELVGLAAGRLPAEIIEHTGIRRIITEMYAAAAAGQVPDLDTMRVRLLDREDLVTAMMDQAELGHGYTERPEKLEKVLADFERLRLEAEKQAVRQSMPAAADNHLEAVDYLRRLQKSGARTAG